MTAPAPVIGTKLRHAAQKWASAYILLAALQKKLASKRLSGGCRDEIISRQQRLIAAAGLAARYLCSELTEDGMNAVFPARPVRNALKMAVMDAQPQVNEPVFLRDVPKLDPETGGLRITALDDGDEVCRHIYDNSLLSPVFRPSIPLHQAGMR